MNRRGFLRSLVVGLVGVAVAPHLALAETPTPIFTELIEAGAVGDFVCYYVWQYELLCDSPRACFILEGISE